MYLKKPRGVAAGSGSHSYKVNQRVGSTPPRPIMNCTCGSGKDSVLLYDSRGVPLVRICLECRDEQLSLYQEEVLSNPDIENDE